MSIRQTARLALASVAVLAALLSFQGAGAQDAMTGVKGEILHQIQAAETKLTQLAEAMPEGKYGWRPDKGVRSVGEVFMHVAAANYGIPSYLGVKPPAGFNFDTYEKSLTKKADIIKAMKDSFAHVEAALKAAPDADMDKQVEMFGQKGTVRATYNFMAIHAHEHLGQAIAYARMNKVVPPWTAAENAAEEKARAAEKAKKK